MGVSILMVEDGPRVGQFVARFLRKEGHEVRCAVSGEEGLRLARERMPDVVLLDLVLPGIDGLEVLRQIKLVDTNVAVIMMTAHSTVPVAVEAMRLGALDFLAKPIDLEVLCERLTTLVSMATGPAADPPLTAPSSTEARADVRVAQQQELRAAAGREPAAQDPRPAPAGSVPAPAPEHKPPNAEVSGNSSASVKPPLDGRS